MKDERIIKEMNQVKKYVLLYVFIAAAILGVLKLILFGFNLSMFYVEGFIIVTSVLLFSIVSLNFVGNYDERIERRVGVIYHIGFIFIFIGGLWVHFYQVLASALAQSTVVYVTNTLILVGFIVALILLKKRKLYANYKYIEYSKSSYYFHVFINVLVILATFIGIYLTVLLSMNYPIDISGSLYFIATITVSFVMISIEYVLFSIYEKNHYDEEIAFENENPSILSKNAFLFQIIVFIFTYLSGYVNYRLMMITTGSLIEHQEELQTWSILQSLTKLAAIDFAILGLMVSLIIYYYLKKLIGKHKILSLYLVLNIVSFIIQVLEYVFSLVMPLLQSVIELHENFIKLITTYSQINLGISVIFGLIYFTLGIYLYIKNVPFKTMFLIYSILLVIFNPAVSGIFFKRNLEVLFTVRFVASTLLAAYVLLIIGVLAYHKYDGYRFHHALVEDELKEVYE